MCRGIFARFFDEQRRGTVCRCYHKIVFEKEFRNPDALRGIESFSHLWLIWNFSESETHKYTPTVRPPRLGGNKKVGVFATRSPFRPNPIGLSSVKLEAVQSEDGLGTVLYVRGADILNGTAIYDIKPYITYSDSHPDAKFGFAEENFGKKLKANVPESILSLFEEDRQKTLIAILEDDPRPSYQDSPEREYGMKFADKEIFFKVANGEISVTAVK